MKTIRIKLYKFEELTADAQQNAIEKFRETSEVFLDFFQDSAKEQIEKAGFYDNIELGYSLSYSQGDGLCFSCQRINSEVLKPLFAEILGEGKDKTISLIIDNCYFTCTGNKGRYSYASRNDIEYIFDSGITVPNIEEVVSKVETKIADLYTSLCKDLENQGYAEIEYQQSDEAIKETILANDYDFTKDGKLY